MSYVIYADGGSRGNPGVAGAGAAVFQNNVQIAGLKKGLGTATNNVAEYEAMIMGLEHLCTLDHGEKDVVVKMDSELVIKQMRGEYKVKHPGLRPLYERARHLSGHCRSIVYEHIPRAQNAVADALANEAMDEASARR